MCVGFCLLQEAPSPYAHLIMEDHAKLLGLATCYLQTYGIPGGEGAILNINQREEMAERHRQAVAAAMALNGVNGHVHHGGGMGGWNGNAAAVAAVEASRHSRGMSGGGGGGMYSGYRARYVRARVCVCVLASKAGRDGRRAINSTALYVMHLMLPRGLMMYRSTQIWRT